MAASFCEKKQVYLLTLTSSLVRVCSKVNERTHMNLSRRQLANLHIAVAASVHGAVMNKGRSKPDYAARISKEHADAAVRAHSGNGKRSGKQS